MNNNDFVAMAEHVCPICGIKHTYGTEILLHKQLKKIPKDQRVTGYGLCEEHQKLLDDGYIALVAVNNAPTQADNAVLKVENADRTGDILHLRKTIFNEMFNTTISDEQKFVFIDKEVCEILKKESKRLEEEVA